MTFQETEATAAPAPTPAAEHGPAWRAIASVVVVLLAAGAALGSVGGWLWYQWWGPPNTGEIYDTATWGPRWFDLSAPGLAQQFDGPAQYAVVALGLGSVLGVLAALLGRRQSLAALGALIAGSALAAYLAFVVGTALSPPDPQQFATSANVGKEYPAAIEVSGWTPFLCWPIGSLAAFCTVIAASSGAREMRRQQAGRHEAGRWLEPSGRGATSPSPPPST